MNYVNDGDRDYDRDFGRIGRRLNLSNARIPVPPRPASDSQGENQIDLGELFAQLLARKWLIVLGLILGLAAGAFFAIIQPNQFRALSVVQIEQRSSGVPLPNELIGDLLAGEKSDSELATELHIIKSRLILDPVVRDLNLTLIVTPKLAPVIGHFVRRTEIPFLENALPAKYARKGDEIAVGQFLVSDAMLKEDFTLVSNGDGAFTLTGPDGDAVTGRVGETVRLGSDVEMRIDAMDLPAGRTFNLRSISVRDAVKNLTEYLSVSEREWSEVVDFEYEGGDPAQGARIVNAIVQTYRDQNLGRRSAEIDQTIDFIEKQIPEVREELSKATDALTQYQRDQKSEELSLGTVALLERAVRLESSLRELEFREQLLNERLAPDHPDLQSLRAGKVQLEGRLQEVRDSLAAVPEAERDLVGLTERAEWTRELLSQLTNRVEQLRILKASAVANIRVLETAEGGDFIGPNRKLLMLIGGVLGLFLAVLRILMRNVMSRGIEDARAVEELGLSLFATVNKVKGLPGLSAGDKNYALATTDPKSLVAESLRGLRTGLQFSLSAAQSKTLMITSCAPSDGKSFISLNLSLVSAETSNRVLLMDCDLRRGKLCKHFGLTRKHPGLSEFLAGSAKFADVVTKDPATGLEFIGTGAYPPNPSELLATQRFASLVHDLSEHYDLIVLDAPPVLAVTDPGIIGQTAGMSLMVVNYLKTTKMEIQSAQKTLATAGVNLSGVVLNMFDQKLSRYGAYGAKYGYDRAGYTYEYR